jgi:hypothetical protein
MYILSADGRFPHIRPGDQKAEGDHFLALYPSQFDLHLSAPTRSSWTMSLSAAVRRVFGATRWFRGGFDRSTHEGFKSSLNENTEFFGWPCFASSNSGSLRGVDISEVQINNSTRRMWLQSAANLLKKTGM